MITNCQNCGANLTTSICEYCGTKSPSVEVSLKEVRMDMGKFDVLENTYLIGNMNKVNRAVNCKITGNMNKVAVAVNCQIEGNMNKVIKSEDG